MNGDLSELIKYLDEKFAAVDGRFQEVDQSFDRAFEVFATKDDTKEIKQELVSLREVVQALAISVDRLVKAVSDLKTEYSVISHQLTRHEKWIQQLAEKIGINLEF